MIRVSASITWRGFRDDFGTPASSTADTLPVALAAAASNVRMPWISRSQQDVVVSLEQLRGRVCRTSAVRWRVRTGRWQCHCLA